MTLKTSVPASGLRGSSYSSSADLRQARRAPGDRAGREGHPGALTSSYYSTGNRTYVSADRHTTFQEVYLPGRGGCRPHERRRRDASGGGRRPSNGCHGRRDRPHRARRGIKRTGGGSSVLLEALIGGLGALVILLFVFGTLPAVVMPLVVAVAAILNTFTLVWPLTYVTDVSIIVQFLIALVGLGVAIDYALLMIFRFRDELREGTTSSRRSSRR